jgi:tetratricopeptide (TPR) repeat protein
MKFHATMAAILASALLLGGCAAQLGNGSRTAGILGLKTQADQAYADGNRSQALADYQQYIGDVPNDGQAWTRIGNLHLMANQPQQAVNAYKKALAIDRNDMEALHNLAVVRLRQAHAAMLVEYNTLSPRSSRAQSLACSMAWLTLLEQGGNGPAPKCKP